MKTRLSRYIPLFVVVLFWTFVLGRLSIIPDYIFSLLNVDIFDRLMTKLIWIVLYAVLSVIFCALYIKFNKKSLKTDLKEFIHDNKKMFIVLGLILFSSLMSAVWGYDISTGIQGFFYYLVLLSIPIFVKFFWRDTFVDEFKKGLYILGIIAFMIAIVQFFSYSCKYNFIHDLDHCGINNPLIKIFDNYGGFMPLSYFNLAVENNLYLRPSSMLVDPNFAGLFAASVVIFALNDVLRMIKLRESIKKYVLEIGSFICCSAFILLTASRTAVLAIIVGLVAFCLSKWIFKAFDFKPKGLFSVSFLSVFWDRLKQGLTLSDQSSKQHLQLADAALNMFTRYPVFGVGIGNYSAYYAYMLSEVSSMATPHSAYFRILSELGGFGMIVFIVFWIYVFSRILVKKDRVLLALFMVIMAGNVTYDFMMTPWVWFYFALMMV